MISSCVICTVTWFRCSLNNCALINYNIIRSRSVRYVVYNTMLYWLHYRLWMVWTSSVRCPLACYGPSWGSCSRSRYYSTVRLLKTSPMGTIRDKWHSPRCRAQPSLPIFMDSSLPYLWWVDYFSLRFWQVSRWLFPCKAISFIRRLFQTTSGDPGVNFLELFHFPLAISTGDTTQKPTWINYSLIDIIFPRPAPQNRSCISVHRCRTAAVGTNSGFV